MCPTRALAIAAVAGLVAISAALRAQAGGLRIALLSSAEVHNDTILLANLLPPRVPQPIRDAAQNVPLGAAPQPGSMRLLASETLRSAVTDAGLSPAQFAIPEVVTVRRGERFISASDVFAAIQSAEANNPALALPPLRPEDLAQIPAVPVPPDFSGLQVAQATLDPLLGEMRFRLVAKSSPGLLPFYVTAKLPSSSPSAAQRSSNVQNLGILDAALHPPKANRDSVPPLVTTSHLARLHLHSADMDMLLEVRPLQKGHLNEVIRVCLLPSGKTLQAQVVGENYLDATL
jgi:hypothetical protein